MKTKWQVTEAPVRELETQGALDRTRRAEEAINQALFLCRVAHLDGILMKPTRHTHERQIGQQLKAMLETAEARRIDMEWQHHRIVLGDPVVVYAARSRAQTLPAPRLVVVSHRTATLTGGAVYSLRTGKGMRGTGGHIHPNDVVRIQRLAAGMR